MAKMPVRMSWIVWHERGSDSFKKKPGLAVRKERSNERSLDQPINESIDLFRGNLAELDDKRSGAVFTFFSDRTIANQIKIDDHPNVTNSRTEGIRNKTHRVASKQSMGSDSVRRSRRNSIRLEKNAQKIELILARTTKERSSGGRIRSPSVVRKSKIVSDARPKDAYFGGRFSSTQNDSRAHKMKSEPDREKNSANGKSPSRSCGTNSNISHFQEDGYVQAPYMPQIYVARRRTWSQCDDYICECHKIPYIDQDDGKAVTCSQCYECCLQTSVEKLDFPGNRGARFREAESPCRCCTPKHRINELKKKSRKFRRNSSLKSVNKYFSSKYQKLQSRFRSRSSPPCPDSMERHSENWDREYYMHRKVAENALDVNMNGRCSVCNQRCCSSDENYCDSDEWEHLLACSCKSHSMLDVDKLSLLVHPNPSPYSVRTRDSCQCQSIIEERYIDSVKDTVSVNSFPGGSPDMKYGNRRCNVLRPESERSLFCEECVREANLYPPTLTCDPQRQLPSAPLEDDRVFPDRYYDPNMTLADMKKYGLLTRKKMQQKEQPKKKEKWSKVKHHKKRRRKYSTASGILNTLSVCLPCTLGRHDGGSSSSGGSGSDDDGEDAEGDMDDGYEEHGVEVSDGGDSDGGDSGSGSADASMNSAELFDDQFNAMDVKDNNNLDGSDGGGDVESECTDSLTELGTEESEETDSSDEDSDSECADGEDGSNFDSLQSIIICEME